MTTFVELVRTELVAATAVTDLVGAPPAARIYPGKAPQGTPAPYLVLQVVSDVPKNSVDGAAATRLHVARFQVDAYASTYLSAWALAGAVVGVIADLSRPDLNAYLDGQRDVYDDQTPELRRVSMDFSVSA